MRKTLSITNAKDWVTDMETNELEDRYLKILKEREEATTENYKVLEKKTSTARIVMAATIRERMAFEKGMGK